VRTNQRVLLVKLACVLTLPLWLSGCITPEEHESRGVKLSDAMNASASGDKRDLGGNRSYEPTPDADATVSSDMVGGFDFAGVSYDNRDYFWQVPADVSYSMPFNGEIQGITHFTLTPFSLESERNFLGLYVGGAMVDLKTGSLPSRAVDNTWMLEAGLTYRHYLSPARTGFSPYIAASAGYVWLNWDYRNPIVAGGDTIQSDSLGGGEGSIAFGISTRRESRVSAFGEVGLGGTIFSDTTSQGFDNDVFHNFGFVTFKVGASLKF